MSNPWEAKTTMDDVGVVFVNAVLGRGIHCGVANINFGTFLFTPAGEREVDDGRKITEVDPQLVCSLRLRLDEMALRMLHDATAALIKTIDEDKAKREQGTIAPPSGDGVATKPN